MSRCCNQNFFVADYVAYRLLRLSKKEVVTMQGENESRLSGEDKNISKEKD